MTAQLRSDGSLRHLLTLEGLYYMPSFPVIKITWTFKQK